MDRLALDVAHLFAGGLVLVSFMLLYQDRMTGLVNNFALHALVVSLSVAWQAHIQQAPHLYITAAIALTVKAVVIPLSDKTQGHATHTIAAVWKPYLDELLKMSAK